MGTEQQQQFADNPLAGRETEELQAPLEISQSLLHSINLDELLLYIISKVKELMHAEGAAVILLDETQSEFFFCSADSTSEKCAVKLKEIRFKHGHFIGVLGLQRLIPRPQETCFDSVSSASTRIPVLVPHNLKMFVRNMLSDGGNIFLGSEDLEIFLLAPIGHDGPIQHLAAVLDIGDPRSGSSTSLLFREGVPQDIFHQRFLTIAVISGDAVSGMDAEAAVAPVHELFDELVVYLALTLQHGQDLGAEDLILPFSNKRMRLCSQR
jgi:hypothetical protein